MLLHFGQGTDQLGAGLSGPARVRPNPAKSADEFYARHMCVRYLTAYNMHNVSSTAILLPSVLHDAIDVRDSKVLGLVSERRRVSRRGGTIRSAGAIPAADGGALQLASTSPFSGGKLERSLLLAGVFDHQPDGLERGTSLPGVPLGRIDSSGVEMPTQSSFAAGSPAHGAELLALRLSNLRAGIGQHEVSANTVAWRPIRPCPRRVAPPSAASSFAPHRAAAPEVVPHRRPSLWSSHARGHLLKEFTKL